MAMDNDSVKNKVVEIVSTILQIQPSELSPNSMVGDFPTWDSLGHLTILQRVQDDFGIEFEPEEMMDIEDLKDIIEIVGRKLQK